MEYLCVPEPAAYLMPVLFIHCTAPRRDPKIELLMLWTT